MGEEDDSLSPQPAPYAPAPAVALMSSPCDWSAKPIKGSIKGHNIGGKHNGKTLEECQAICDAEDTCKSIDYSASKKRCYLGDCALGGECKNSGDKKYEVYACAKAKEEEEEEEKAKEDGGEF